MPLLLPVLTLMSLWGKWMQWYLSFLVERLITRLEVPMSPVGIPTNSLRNLLPLLQQLSHPVSEEMLLMVSPMILILLTILLSHHLKKMNLKGKTPLSQLTLLLLRVILLLLLLLLLLLKKSICLCLILSIGLRRKTKPMLKRWERPSLKPRSTFLYSTLFSRRYSVDAFIC